MNLKTQSNLAWLIAAVATSVAMPGVEIDRLNLLAGSVKSLKQS
ncbi:secreted protein [Rhodopirellula europaea SH398]|uniref:Secreted protein n=1 Tax=Rhodopirellula europaea SH398 TaxID=1263868 RepID=M5S365_9BACT|nr:secreted protein [Rhodopirellula europaea SH398]